MAALTRSRFWCFTLNNPDGNLDVDLDIAPVRYAVWQLEVGEEGTEHFQGYLELATAQRLSFLQNLIPGGHFEQRRRTAVAARLYCMKEEGRREGPWEIGVFSAEGQGKRNDLLDIKRKLDQGTSEVTIAEEHFGSWLRYNKGFKEYKRMKTTPRDHKTIVTYLYGKPGLGKSRKAHEDLPNAHWLTPPKDKSSAAWWTDYDNNDAVVIDDFFAWLPWNLLLRIMDRYPLTVEAKGTNYQFIATKLYITSNHLPEDLYNPQFPIDALTRRIERWIFFEENAEPQIFNDYLSFINAVKPPLVFNQHRMD